MEYHNNTLAISYGELVPDILSMYDWDNMKRSRKLHVIRRACYQTPALVHYESLPAAIKTKVIKMYGDPKQKTQKKNGLASMLEHDAKAIEFFSHYMLTDGRLLPEKYQREYVANSSVLNAMLKCINETKSMRASRQGSTRNIWGNMTEAVMNVRSDEYPHTLPASEKRLKMKLHEYTNGGYESLISGKFCNQNTRKVTALIERLILSLYCQKNKPFAINVHELYLQFLGGAFEVVDVMTGEMIDRMDYYNEKGEPITISEATVWHYINMPKNRAIVDKFRSGNLQYDNIHRPHYRRHCPDYSFSKISMDDMDIPRKMHNGQRVKAYYAYDVKSGCLIGRAYSKEKTLPIIYECFRNMFRWIDDHGYGMPLQVEVEHHLMGLIEDKLNEMFKFVRFCAPSNSKEKRAEHNNRAKKYSVDKQLYGAGRWSNKGEAYRVDVNKVDNEYKEKTYDYEQIVSDDIYGIEKYNNSLHPNQKLYKGMTRLQVLHMFMNPDLPKINKPVLIRAIGNCTVTSITRNQAVKVQYKEYQLSHPAIIGRLLPNNYTVDAYWLPDSNDEIKEVYIYQDGCFIDTCKRIERYNEAIAERTEQDETIRTNQAKYISQYDKMIKDNKQDKVMKMEIINNESAERAIATPVMVSTASDISTSSMTEINENENYDELIKKYQDIDYKEIGIERT